MLARKLASDFESTPVGIQFQASADNLWHRIAGGTEATGDRLDVSLIQQARAVTSIVTVTDDPDVPGLKVAAGREWLSQVKAKISGDRQRRWIVIIDNAERGHFLQSLVDLPDADFVRVGDAPEALKLASQRFVGAARQELRGCLFLLLTNNDGFASSLEAGINAQHQGMLTRTNLPLPGPVEKETVVRVNTNRLNPISYWYCLDRAGPTEKEAVYSALNGASTFPASFAAVDAAIKSSTRLGRRAKSCLLSLIILTEAENDYAPVMAALGDVWRKEVDYRWISIATFDGRWAQQVLPSRDAGLLESEWMLRVVILGGTFVRTLLSGDPARLGSSKQLLEKLKTSYGPGTWQVTLEKNEADLKAMIDAWPDVSDVNVSGFWSMGQKRSTMYEPVLQQLLGDFNQGGSGFLGYRPDKIVTSYVPCSILSAASSSIDDINNAIYRDAHVFEFTAIEKLSADLVQGYLRAKLPNYVEVVREQ